jgi:hypothetical protein
MSDMQLVVDQQRRIEQLEAALKEAGEMWVRKDNHIEQLEERMRGADALIALWETRATRAEARVEQLEKHKKLQTEDVMNLGAALGQAVLAEREACAAIAAKRPHHSGIEIAELIHDRSDT